MTDEEIKKLYNKIWKELQEDNRRLCELEKVAHWNNQWIHMIIDKLKEAGI